MSIARADLEPAAIYVDSEGCVLFHQSNGEFFAFGHNSPLCYDDLAEADKPHRILADSSGKVLLDDLGYPNGSPYRE